jgi:hypothetical protein
VPWGVAELKRLDLYDTLVSGGAHVTSRFVLYDPAVPVEEVVPVVVEVEVAVPRSMPADW